MDGCGYVVVLEAGDNVRDLGNVGLNRKGGGLLGSFPEYVELLDVGGGLQAHKVTVLTSHRPGHTTRRWNNG
ncbi:hypothetical protein [Paenibacillus harenae]|uniref:hypothetical protein n=1 Tax=Paenibacillus harenae TaxID=306543 RepID=UPI0027947BBC|nr:hypothetical protein [Paenibacillus harenae]MDQ0060740.1 hypothetical protein [Paenibacillus harenae]